MYLSKHVKLSEVTKSNTAIKLGIDNNPTEEHLANIKVIVLNIFEPIREHFGVPIYVSSGYRSEALNKAIGGSNKSQHSLGQALDLDQDNRNSTISNFDIFNYIKDKLDFDQLIFEFGEDSAPDWVHVSYRENGNRNQILKSTRVNKNVKYSIWNG